MANFTFSVKKGNKKPTIQTTKKPVEKPKQITVELTKHDAVSYEPECYLYTNELGETVKYSGVITTDLDGSYVGKIINTHKVVLNYHPRVNAQEHTDEYFSYIDNNGIERVFIGQPEFDFESNTYFGKVIEDILQDEIITIYKR